MPESMAAVYKVAAYVLMALGFLAVVVRMVSAVSLVRLDDEGRRASRGGTMAGAGVFLVILGQLGWAVTDWYLSSPLAQWAQQSQDLAADIAFSVLPIITVIGGCVFASYTGHVIAMAWRDFVLRNPWRWSAGKAREDVKDRRVHQHEDE